MKQISRSRNRFLSKNKVFRRRGYNFIKMLQKGFEGKLCKDFRDFQRYGRMKSQNDRHETRVRLINRAFRRLKFFQDFISDKWVVSSRNSKIF